jgi:hypothetical protein
VTCGRRPIRKFQRKSPRRISPRGLQSFRDDVAMPVICPTCQTFLRATNQKHKWDETALTSSDCRADSSGPSKKPAAVSRRELYNLCDNIDVPAIRPTCQARVFFSSAHRMKLRVSGYTANASGTVDVFRRCCASDFIRPVLCCRPSRTWLFWRRCVPLRRHVLR